MKANLTAYAGLVCLLALTYGLSTLPLGGLLGTVVSMVIALAKAGLIVTVFMEFGSAGLVSRVWLFVGLGWLAILCGIVMDYVSRQWDPRPASWNPRAQGRVIGTSPNSGSATPLESR